MPSSRMFLPPVTQDLWPVLRDRIATAAMGTILGGTGRVHVEGDYSGAPAGEVERWGRAVVVPVLPVGGIRFEEGLPVRLRFLVRTDFNDVAASGYNPSRSAELAQREAARQLANWEPVLVSTQIMALSPVILDEMWQPRVLYDPDVTGTVFLSSSYLVDVASAAD